VFDGLGNGKCNSQLFSNELMEKEKIKENLKFIQTVIEEPVSKEDIGFAVEKGLKLTELSGLAAECEANAKRLADLKLAECLTKTSEMNLPATIITKISQGQAAEEFALYEYAVRINRFISHNLDFIRSVISLHKEEMNKI